MKVAVVGLWHLGSVTAACLASLGIEVIAFDPSFNQIQTLKKGAAPLFEPGLNDLIVSGMSSKLLHFTCDFQDIAQADIIWITFDTQIDENDKADSEYIITEIKKIIPSLQKKSLILISSQIPVGTTRQLLLYCQNHFADKEIQFACQPENLRLGKAIETFMKPDRIVAGLEAHADKSKLEWLFNFFNTEIIWMSLESAEMMKHALNTFLATSVVFINEFATLCQKVGADVRDIEKGLKSDVRIGHRAYLRAGNAISGGTLIRDVNYVLEMANQHHLEIPLVSSLLQSNQAHKQWSSHKLFHLFKDLKGKTITALGLTYKPGTNTLRRSSTIETCKWLAEQGAVVKAFDPVIQDLPREMSEFIELNLSLETALADADAVIIGTEWPEFTKISVEQILNQVKQAFVIDAGGFLAKNLRDDPRIHYFSVGH